MRKIDTSREALKFIQNLSPKHERQVAMRIFELGEHPDAPDTKVLVGYAPLRRASIGEYRIIYSVHTTEIKIILVGKRNDGAIYRELRKKFG